MFVGELGKKFVQREQRKRGSGPLGEGEESIRVEQNCCVGTDKGGGRRFVGAVKEREGPWGKGEGGGGGTWDGMLISRRENNGGWQVQ